MTHLSNLLAGLRKEKLSTKDTSTSFPILSESLSSRRGELGAHTLFLSQLPQEVPASGIGWQLYTYRLQVPQILLSFHH